MRLHAGRRAMALPAKRRPAMIETHNDVIREKLLPKVGDTVRSRN
jgi:hypothetical protein